MKNAFYFILKALFTLKMFGHVGKIVWLESLGWSQNLLRHNLVNK